MGIEPTLSAWEADALPLSYTRTGAVSSLCFQTVAARNSAAHSYPHTTCNYSYFILNQIFEFVNRYIYYSTVFLYILFAIVGDFMLYTTFSGQWIQ